MLQAFGLVPHRLVFLSLEYLLYAPQLKRVNELLSPTAQGICGGYLTLVVTTGHSLLMEKTVLATDILRTVNYPGISAMGLLNGFVHPLLSLYEVIR